MNIRVQANLKFKYLVIRILSFVMFEDWSEGFRILKDQNILNEPS